MMKTIQNYLLLLSALLMIGSAHAVTWMDNVEIVNIEYISALRVVDGGTDKAYIDYKECPTCKSMKLKITAQTAVYQNGEAVSASSLKNRLGREASLRYNSETMNVISVTTY